MLQLFNYIGKKDRKSQRLAYRHQIGVPDFKFFIWTAGSEQAIIKGIPLHSLYTAK